MISVNTTGAKASYLNACAMRAGGLPGLSSADTSQARWRRRRPGFACNDTATFAARLAAGRRGRRTAAISALMSSSLTNCHAVHGAPRSAIGYAIAGGERQCCQVPTRLKRPFSALCRSPRHPCPPAPRCCPAAAPGGPMAGPSWRSPVLRGVARCDAALRFKEAQRSPARQLLSAPAAPSAPPARRPCWSTSSSSPGPCRRAASPRPGPWRPSAPGTSPPAARGSGC